jgi:zinc transport system substrate-binding protein
MARLNHIQTGMYREKGKFANDLQIFTNFTILECVPGGTMNKHFPILMYTLLLVPALVFSTGNREQTPSDALPIVAVSILPQAYFVDRIAPSLVDTLTLVGEGQNPHSYEPSPSQMARLAKADVWVLSGTDFEHALEDKIQALYPNLLVVDGTKGMTFRTLEAHGHDEEEAHEEHDEHDLNIDRHTWLGWSQAKVLVKNTEQALLSVLDEQHHAVVQANTEALLSEMDALFSDMQKKLAHLSGSTVFVYHPSFGYFLDSLSLIQEAVETGGKEPTARDLSLLIEKAKAEQAKAIFVQKQFPVASAQTLAKSVGAEVVALDPLAYEWMENIRLMSEALLRVGKGRQ